MAITAWLAKVSSSSICLAEKGWTPVPRVTKMTPSGVPSRSSGVGQDCADAGPGLPRAGHGLRELCLGRQISSTWIVRRSAHHSSANVSRRTGRRSPIAIDRRSGPCRATRRRCSPSRRQIAEFVAPQTRAAFSTTASHDRLEIGRRARDHPQDLGRGRLLLQRLGHLRWPVSDVPAAPVNSRTFSMAMTAWSAKVVTREISRSSKGSTLVRKHPDHADHAPLTQHGAQPDSVR